ncbi:pyridine nucleotide-disulfide oxidoreductase, partial [Methylobacterium sp. WL12]
VESINRAGDHMIARRILGAGRTPTPAQAADPTFDLKLFAMA